METTSYTANMRDIEFVLFEHLPMLKVLGNGPFSELTVDDIKMILQVGSDFASDVLAPTSKACDKIGCHWDAGKVTVPPILEGVWGTVKEQGWPGVAAPAEFGGQGLPKAVVTALDEMMIGANPAFHTYVGLCRASASLLLNHGSEYLKTVYVPKLISGEWQGTMCLTEPGAGSDVGASLSKAIPVGDGTYKITGTKCFITAGEHQLTENHIHLVLARLPDAPAGVKGLSLFLVPKIRVDDEGNLTVPNDVYCSKIEEKMGIHGSATTMLNFGDNDDCLGYLVGEAHQGIKCMFHMMNEERIVVGLQGQALAAAIYNHALKFAQERVQGSDIGQGKSITDVKVPIVAHPDVRRMLMIVKAYADGGRALLYATAQHLDQVEIATDENVKAYHDARAALLTPICKAWGSDSGVEACSQALQVFGGYGYTADYPAEQAFRDSRIAPIYEGTNGIQALDLLFRKVTAGGGKVFESLLNDIGSFVKENLAHPTLAKEIKALADSTQELGLVSRNLLKGSRDDIRLTALSATPYLTLMGNVVVAWLLMQQAVIASARLEAFELPTELEARRQALEDRDEARFYAGKVDVARFFVHQILTQNRWKAAQIASNDRSAIEVVF